MQHYEKQEKVPAGVVEVWAVAVPRVSVSGR